MKALLICPGLRPAVSALGEFAPLSSIPMLGKNLLEYWLEYLVRLGAKDVIILANDRPQHVREFVSKGERWGLRVEVIEEARELSPAQARLKYQPVKQNDWLGGPLDVTCLDHFPGLRECSLFTSYADFFTSLQLWLPRAKSSDRIGLRELQPGVWVGLHPHISPSARLQSPCWIGDYVHIGAHAVVGPMAILESRVCVENGAEISQSVVGTNTFVGALTEIKNSFASGNNLSNWKTGACVKVPDAFVLSALPAGGAMQPPAWLEMLRTICAASKEDLQTFWRHLLLPKENWDGGDYENSAAKRNIKS